MIQAGIYDGDRLLRGPAGWRRRLALIEAVELFWFVGDLIGMKHLSLWMAMLLSGVQEDTAVLAHAGWAVRPRSRAGSSSLLERRDPKTMDNNG